MICVVELDEEQYIIG